MPRIVDDPNRAVCPSFEDPEWEFLRQSAVNAHQGDQPLTLAEAAQQMKDAWSRENQCKTAAWNDQAQQDQVEQDELDRVAREREDALRAQQEVDAEDLCKEAEKKKPKLNSWDPNCQVEKWIEARPAAYALNKLNNLEYVELDYFTPKGCKDTAADMNRSVSHNTLTFTQLGDTFAICPLAAVRSSKHIRNDEDLSWEEMLNAKNVMLHFMGKSGVWPIAHATSIASFFINIECHPRKSQKNGKRALMLYQGRVRHEWFDALKRDEGFNLEVIQEELLRSLAEEINDTIQDRDNAARDREMANATFDSRAPSKRQHAHSRSPPRVDPLRRHRRSRSPPRSYDSPPDHLEKHTRDNPRHARQDKPEVFQSGAGPRGGVCVVCLGCHDHSFSRCDEVKLWDGSPNAVRKNKQGRLVTTNGLPLCFDWQIRGCGSTSHPDQHKCSGCGKADHGAQGCPRAEK
ncbi:hypothetical protein V8E53_000303, partial [Lactarius tabidus]